MNSDGERIEQDRVDVVAHAEGEELRALGCGALGHFEDAVGLLDADRGQPIGQEDDRPRALAVEELHAPLERATDVGVAASGQLAHVVDAGARVRGRPQDVVEGADVAGEVDHRETVVGTEVVEHELGSADGLGHLVAFHRARAVEDEHDVTRDGLVQFDDGCEEEVEVAVVATLPVRQQASVDEALATGEVEPEVGVRRPAVGRLPAEAELALALALLVELEARGHRRAHLPGHVDIDFDLGAGRARRHARPGHFHQRLLALCQQRRGHGEADLPLLAGRDREGTHFVHVALERTQQGRVDEPAHDVLVDARGVIGVEQHPLEGLGPAREHQIGD